MSFELLNSKKKVSIYLAITSIVLATRIGCGGSFFRICTKHVWKCKMIEWEEGKKNVYKFCIAAWNKLNFVLYKRIGVCQKKLITFADFQKGIEIRIYKIYKVKLLLSLNLFSCSCSLKKISNIFSISFFRISFLFCLLYFCYWIYVWTYDIYL